MQLSCKPKKRLSIYSAQYGRTVNGQALHCSTANDQLVSKGKFLNFNKNIYLTIK